MNDLRARPGWGAAVSSMSRWAPIALLAVLLSACRLGQEIRFNADGSGSATGTFLIGEDCLDKEKTCSPWERRLLRGEGPVANATADADSLPFDVRIGPLPVADAEHVGYTLSFDFASAEDLRDKLAPHGDFPAHVSTHRRDPSLTSPFTFYAMALDREGRRLTFSASTALTPCEVGVDDASFAIVLPGERIGPTTADVVERVDGGTRFKWNMAGSEEREWIQASTVPEESAATWPPFAIAGGAAALGVAIAGVVLARARRRSLTTPTSGDDAIPAH